MSRYKFSSAKPTAKELEKVAKHIVITVKEDGADPYEEIQNTGLPMPLMETLLKKFNIHNFLNDFDSHEGDPHMRDVDCPPLSLDKLKSMAGPANVEEFDVDGGKGMESTQTIDEPGVKGVIKKKTVTIPTKSQASDMRSMKGVDIGEGEALKEENPAKAEEVKEASENIFDPFEVFDEYSTAKLAAAVEDAEAELSRIAHTYKGYIEKVAHDELYLDRLLEQELGRVYSNSKIAQHIFLAAGLDAPKGADAAYVLSQSKRADEVVARGTELLEKVAEQQDLVELLRVAYKHRKENYQ